MFHELYAVANIDGEKSVIKLVVEQFDDYDGIGRSRRAYKLTKIEEALVQSTASQADLTHKASSIETVSDLWHYVKSNAGVVGNGTSQVVNPDGTPKIMYRGTATEFWAFDKKKANDLTGRRLGLGAGKGKFYLTEYKGSAQLAADSAQQTGRGNSPKVMELYVSAQKVMDRSEYDQRLKEAYKQYPNSDPRGDVYDYRQRDKAIAAVDKAIIKDGYDGVWDRESGEMFVYDSTQIKSATDNIGLFDRKNPDIRFSMSDMVEETRVFPLPNSSLLHSFYHKTKKATSVQPTSLAAAIVDNTFLHILPAGGSLFCITHKHYPICFTGNIGKNPLPKQASICPASRAFHNKNPRPHRTRAGTVERGFHGFSTKLLAYFSCPFHRVDTRSLGICQPPRGLRPTVPTLGPSGTQLRLNCWV